MQSATNALNEELSRVASDIAASCQKLQCEFDVMSQESLSRGEGEIPNPVQLTRRLSMLERSIKSLSEECEKLHQRRNHLVPSLIQKQKQNNQLLLQISGLVQLQSDFDDGSGSEGFPGSDRGEQKEQELSLKNHRDSILRKFEAQEKFYFRKFR